MDPGKGPIGRNGSDYDVYPREGGLIPVVGELPRGVANVVGADRHCVEESRCRRATDLLCCDS